MDSVGVHSLGSAAAQGGQDTYNEHTHTRMGNTPFTGCGMGIGVRTSRHCRTRPIMVAYTVTNLHMLVSSSLQPVQQCPQGQSTTRAHIHRKGNRHVHIHT